MTTIAVIGGGISGLSTAFHLRQSNPGVEVVVVDNRPKVGGVIQTTRRDGFIIESAADNFITTNTEVLDLCQRLGLDDQLVSPNPTHRQAMVIHRGRLQPIPPGFIVMAPSRLWPMMTTRVLSLLGKIRAGCELFIPRRRDDSDESLESFVCRRFGREMFDRLVQPLVGGIYTADPKLLSLAATMPRFRDMEKQYGSLIRAALKQRRQQAAESSGGARYSRFMSLRGGLGTLIQALVDRLPAGSVRSGAGVVSLRPSGDGGWNVRLADSQPSWLRADGVVLATPASESSNLLAATDQILSSDLLEIPYGTCGVVSLGYESKQIGVPMDSFGFVVPLAEHRLILSCSFSSVKYAGRAPAGHVLLRVFIGGACQSGLMQLPPEQLAELAELEVADLLKIDGSPVIRHVTTHWKSMPQYHVGHCQRVAAIERRMEKYPTLALTGSSLHGVGVPNCIASGRRAAERLLAHFEDRKKLGGATTQVTHNIASSTH